MNSRVTRFFTGTPFALTASREVARCWAGHSDLRASLRRLCRSYTSRPDSSLDVIWANLGAGKSHALFHLMTLLSDIEGPKPISVFVEMPEQPRRFLDFYRRVAPELPLDAVVPHLLTEDDRVPDDLRRVARALVHGASEEAGLAKQWLVAGHPHLRDLRNATGIGTRIEDDGHACQVLSNVAAALADAGVRLVLLLDEFQRIAACSTRQREAILTNLRSIFSRNPAYFSVVLAITSRIERSAMELLPRELRTLMGMRPAVSLPEMSEEEALQFFLERFHYFRPDGYSGPPAAPIGTDSLEVVVSHIAHANSQRLVPRTLLQAAAWIYDEAVVQGVIEMTKAETERLLEQLCWNEVYANDGTDETDLEPALKKRVGRKTE